MTFTSSEEQNCEHNFTTYYTLTYMLENVLCVGTIIHFVIIRSTVGLTN